MTALIQVSDVCVGYGRNTEPIVRDVSLTVSPGATIGIVGESGSGKTTLARAMAGLLDPVSGRVEVSGVAWSDIGRRHPLRRKVQMIFQDPYGSLNPAMTALQTVAEVYQALQGYSRQRAREAARAMLTSVGLADAAQGRRPHGLSGGQCQRVGIARALACHPDVLIADEPTSALDVSVQAQILRLLAELQRSRSLALVMVSHDLGVIRSVTERTLVMYKGEVVEEGPTEELFTHPTNDYTKTLLMSLPENWVTAAS